MRRRPLLRAAAVGGTAYYAGKRGQRHSQQNAYQDQRLDELEQQQAAAQAPPPAPAYAPTYAAAPPPPPPPPAPAPAAPSGSAAQLEQLAALRQAGALTDEEFSSAKARLLSGPAG